MIVVNSSTRNFVLTGADQIFGVEYDAGAHMVVKYAADTKLYIDHKIAALVGG